MVVYLTFMIFTCGLMVAAGISDFLKLRIPNIIPIVITAAFFLCFAVDQLFNLNQFDPLASHLKSGVLVLVIMIALFALKYIGGGDAKLLPAVALWVGLAGLPDFIVITVFAGFPLALIALFLKQTQTGQKIAKKISNYKHLSNGWIMALANGENAVPYGIAIAIGGLVSFYQVGLFP